MRIGVILNYSSLAQIAKNMIGDNGTKVVLRIPQGSPVYNPNTNEYESQEILYNGIAVICNYNISRIDGTVIQSGDLLVKAVLDGEPKAGTSKLSVYNKAGAIVETLNIINVKPVNLNASTVIMYNLQCRK
jgi:hypothetical protein